MSLAHPDDRTLLCPTGKTAAALSIRLRKYIPLYRNSDLSYVSAIPAHQEGRSCVVTVESRVAVDAAASGARGQGQGGLLSVSPSFVPTSGAVRFRRANMSMATCTTLSAAVVPTGRAYGKTVWS
jgi:hypothetical protein